MSFDLRPVDTVDTISPADFQQQYLKPLRPLVIRKLAHQWPAYEKWTFDYLKQVVGDQVVPLYDDSKADYTKSVNEPAQKMPFGEYLELLRREPTMLRIFLFNIFKHVPALCHDFKAPDLMPGFLDSFPMMFFGGQGSSVFIHYDLDLSHVFHTHFHGRKKVILFGPEASERLYRLPFSVHNIEDIKIENPDFDRWPALKGLKGYECTLEHGDTLFMPSGWWHHMTYLDGSFSLSLRALDPRPSIKLHGAYNVFVMRQLDNLGRKVFGAKWFQYKERKALEHANDALSH